VPCKEGKRFEKARSIECNVNAASVVNVSREKCCLVPGAGDRAVVKFRVYGLKNVTQIASFLFLMCFESDVLLQFTLH